MAADPLAVGFTASRDLDPAGEEVILNVLTTAVPHAGGYVTGGAIGGDAFIGRWLAQNRPAAQHLVIVPADRSRVDPWWLEFPGVLLIEMPPGSTYEDRNAELVKWSTLVFGFPAYPEDDRRSRRSGTWQAIRMSRRAGKLSQWHCVKPPYRGLIEAYPSEFAFQGGERGS